MIIPARQDLAGSRWTAFITTLEFETDLTGATFEMHIRQVGDAPDPPLVDLDTVTTAAEEGVRFIAYEAADDGVIVSKIGVRINETTMEALPFPGSGSTGERGDDVNLVWSMHITPSGGIKQRYIRGVFTVESDATQ